MDLPTPPYSAEPLPQELQTLLERHGQPRVVAKGAVVVAEGDPSHAMYLVRDGRLTVFVTDDEGHEVLLNQLGPGEYFGELMLGSPVRTASVRALERSRLVMLPRAVVEAAIHEQPELALHLIRRLVQRIQALSRTVQGLSSMDVYGRMARLFNDLAVEIDGRRVVAEALTQQQIADRVGASRAMVNRVLKDLMRGGYIGTEPRHGRRLVLFKPLPRRW